MRTLAALVLAVFAFAYSQVVLAQAVATAYAFERFMVAAKGSGWTTGANAIGKPVALGPASLTKVHQAALSAGTGVSSGVGAAGVAIKQTVGSAAAGEMAVTTNGLLTAANVLTTFQLLMSGPTGAVLAALIVAPGLIDWLSAAHVEMQPDGTFAAHDISGGKYCDISAFTAYPMSNPGAFCNAVGSGGGSTGSNAKCQAGVTCSNGQFYSAGAGKLVDVYSTQTRPVAWPELNQRLGVLPVPPRAVQDLLDAGASIPVVYPKSAASDASETDTYFPPGVLSMSGPASVLGTPTVTKTNDGTNTTTTTTTPKTTLTYSSSLDANGKSVPTVTATAGSTSVVTVTNNTTNVTTTVSNTEVAAPDTPKEDYSFSDTALIDIPKLYERKYPDGLTGVWGEKITAIKATPIFNLPSNLMPSVGYGGTCPSWPISFDYAGWASFGAHDVAPPCWVWDFGKAVIIVSSLLLARRLIFGG